jgi:hypothetical protein
VQKINIIKNGSSQYKHLLENLGQRSTVKSKDSDSKPESKISNPSGKMSSLNSRISEMFANRNLRSVNLGPHFESVPDSQKVTDQAETGLVTGTIVQENQIAANKPQKFDKKNQLDRIKHKLEQFQRKRDQQRIAGGTDTDSLEYELSEGELSAMRVTPKISMAYLERRNSKDRSISPDYRISN